MNLDAQIEGVLFYKAEPVKKAELCAILGVKEGEVGAALLTLAERLKGGATRLLETDTEVSLVTAPELDAIIENLRKSELKRDIGKAGAETLAIVLYKGPVSRGEIDRIRGVNSSYILRNLSIRGLVERTTSGRQVQFKVTPALLAHLGIEQAKDMPQYDEVLAQLATHAEEQETT